MTLTEAQSKRDRSQTEGHCCAFCCAPNGWVDPFLDAKASFSSNAKNIIGQNPLDIAIQKNQKDIIKLLLANGAKASSIFEVARI
jgi:ankyrin repeat protein